MTTEQNEKPKTIGTCWNLEMAEVRRISDHFRRHLHNSEDFIRGFDFAVRLCEEKFWNAHNQAKEPR